MQLIVRRGMTWCDSRYGVFNASILSEDRITDQQLGLGRSKTEVFSPSKLARQDATMQRSVEGSAEQRGIGIQTRFRQVTQSGTIAAETIFDASKRQVHCKWLEFKGAVL